MRKSDQDYGNQAPAAQDKKMKNIKNMLALSKKKAALTPHDDQRGSKNIKKAMHNLNQNMSGLEQRSAIPFEAFLTELVSDPSAVIRNVFQVFHDMIKAYVGEGAR